MSVQIRTFKPADAKIKALCYGPSGIGKTTFGASAPKPLFVSAEAGLLSVADKGVQYAEIKSLQDLREVYAFLLKGGHGYETVVIDSLTEIQTFIIQQITGGKRMPEKGEWSGFGFEMTKILRAYRDLPLHVIFLALETDKGGDEEGDKSVFMPDLYGKVRTAAAAFMDFVGRMNHFAVQEGDAKVVRRGICFTSNERFVAKDRSGKLPTFVEADFTKILASIGTIPTGEGEVVATIEDKPLLPDDTQLLEAMTAADRLGTLRTAYDQAFFAGKDKEAMTTCFLNVYGKLSNWPLHDATSFFTAENVRIGSIVRDPKTGKVTVVERQPEPAPTAPAIADANQQGGAAWAEEAAIAEAERAGMAA